MRTKEDNRFECQKISLVVGLGLISLLLFIPRALAEIPSSANNSTVSPVAVPVFDITEPATGTPSAGTGSNANTGTNTGSGASAGNLDDINTYVPSQSQALGDFPTASQRFGSVASVVALIFQVIIALSGVVFMIILVSAGVRYLFSAGNEESTASAKKSIFNALAGLAYTLATYAITTFFLSRFGL